MKQYIFEGLAIALLCLNLCCQSKNRETLSSQGFEAHQPSQRSRTDIAMVKKHTATCDCGDSSKLIVETLYKADVDTVSYYKLLILSQDLSIIYGEDTTSLPLPFFDSTFISGKETLIVKKTALYEVKCILNGMKRGYSLNGIHWFDPPHSFYGLCSSEGKWLWYYYGTMHEIFREYNDEYYQKYEQEFGEEINSLKNMIPVLPDFY